MSNSAVNREGGSPALESITTIEFEAADHPLPIPPFLEELLCEIAERAVKPGDESMSGLKEVSTIGQLEMAFPSWPKPVRDTVWAAIQGTPDWSKRVVRVRVESDLGDRSPQRMPERSFQSHLKTF